MPLLFLSFLRVSISLFPIILLLLLLTAQMNVSVKPDYT